MSQLRQRYEAWVRKEASWYLPALDGLKSFTLFLPGRFDKNMLNVEAIYSGLNLVSLYHDSVCDRPRSATFELKCGPETSGVRLSKNMLGSMALVEVLIEMIAVARYKLGKQSNNKWLVILAVEVIKGYCRMVMLRNNGWRMVTGMNPEERNFQMQNKALQALRSDVQDKFSKCPGPYPDVAQMYIDHDRTPKHPHGMFTTGPVAPECHPNESSDRAPPISERAGEMFHIIRPIAYVAGCVASSNQSLLPLWLSLSCDALSRMLSPRSSQTSPAQKAELARRTSQYMLYLARSPIYNRFTRLLLLRLAAFMAKVPLLGNFVSGIIELVMSLQHIYFYTSGS